MNMKRIIVGKGIQGGSFIFLTGLLLVCFLTLADCGGGGGGGGGDGNIGETIITYSGSTEMAVITESNAVDMSVGAYLGGPAVGGVSAIRAVDVDSGEEALLPFLGPIIKGTKKVSISGESAPATRAIMPFTETTPGNCGGSATLTLSVDTDTGNFTGTLQFIDYCEDGETESGTVNVSGSADPATGDIIHIDMSFEQLTVTLAGASGTLSGTASADFNLPTAHLTFNYRIRDNISSKVYQVENYVLDDVEMTSAVETTFTSGRFYHPDFGFVDLSPGSPFQVLDVDIFPSSGELIITGANSTQASLMALDADTFEVTADTDGDGAFDDFDSGPLHWSTGLPAPQPQTLVSGLNDARGITVDSTSVYWTESLSGTVNKIGKDGGAITILAATLNNPVGIAVDATSVYWTENSGGTVKKVSKDGGTVTTLASGLNFPGSIAFDSTSLYWTESVGGTVNKVDKNGGAVTILASGLNSPAGIAVDSTSVYWKDSDTVNKVGINGGTVTTLASAEGIYNDLCNPCVALDSTSVYWTEAGIDTVKKVSINGGSVTTLMAGNNGPTSITVDSSNVYWTEVDIVESPSIKKVSINGGTVTTLASNLGTPNSIAVDSNHVYWTEVDQLKRIPK